MAADVHPALRGSDDPTRAGDRQVILTVEPDEKPAVERAVTSLDGVDLDRVMQSNVIVVTTTMDALAALEALDGVLSIAPNDLFDYQV